MVNTKIRLIIFFATKDGDALYSEQKTIRGTDWGSDQELLISKFRLKLKKVGKTTWPFRHDLNQILYKHTMEVTDSFEGLDLVDRVSEELWTEICNNVQETVTKTIPKKKKCKKAKYFSKKGLQIAEKRSKRQRRRGKIYPNECRIPENSKKR